MSSALRSPSGSLFVIAAPSGAGKSSLVRALLAQDPQLQLSISHTTRAPRGQERDGVEYHFVDEAAFDHLAASNSFLESAGVHNHRYGTSRLWVEEQLGDGRDILLEIDYQGAFQIQKILPQSCLIFILPPSLSVLRQRIVSRGEDSAERIELRMSNAALEVQQAPRFDYTIINDSFADALLDLQSIVRSSRLRSIAQQWARAEVFAALGIDSIA